MKILGCDISKNTIDIYDLQNERFLKIPNRPEGFKKLAEILPLHEYQVCLEHTGNYYEDFADFLITRKSRVSVVNPLKIKHYAKSRFSRTKTDKQDAKIIAHYCRDHRPEADYRTPTEEQYQTKRLISHINYLNKQQTAIKNRISASKDPFITDQLKQHLQDVKAYIKTAKSRLNQLNATQSEKISTIPAVGKNTAVIISHYLNLYKFSNANEFTAFAGLSPQHTQSGTSINKPDRLSSYGNRILKTALYMPAVVAYRIGMFKELVQRMRAKNKPAKVIITAIMRKLAVLAFTLHSRNEPYRTEEQRKTQPI